MNFALIVSTVVIQELERKEVLKQMRKEPQARLKSVLVVGFNLVSAVEEDLNII